MAIVPERGYQTCFLFFAATMKRPVDDIPRERQLREGFHDTFPGYKSTVSSGTCDTWLIKLCPALTNSTLFWLGLERREPLDATKRVLAGIPPDPPWVPPPPGASTAARPRRDGANQRQERLFEKREMSSCSCVTTAPGGDGDGGGCPDNDRAERPNDRTEMDVGAATSSCRDDAPAAMDGGAKRAR